MQGIRKSLAFLCAASLAAACAVASTARDVTVGVASGAFLAVQLMFGALCFTPATVAQFVGADKLAGKLERLGFLAHYRTYEALAHMRWMLGGRLYAALSRTGLILHAFPGTVTADIGFGIVGELAFDGPCRTQPGRIQAVANGKAATDNAIGRWFTMAADGTFMPGGAGAIGGVFMNPKNQVSLGTSAGGALAPTSVVPDGTIGEFCYMGAIVVAQAAAVVIGAAGKYNTTTGVIGSGAPGAGEAAIPNSKFIRYANAAAGLAVLELTN